ncbi:MAG TPA: hypothetical protein VG265_05960 [Gaiellaceae bacterium]|nr:hypothetical protein [Gaiellaceae bacterium]
MIEPAAAESWFDLPAEIESPLEVYVNGIPQKPDVDYRLVGKALVFPRPLEPEVKMSKLQWLLVALGVTGSHKKYDSVDVIYERDGRRLVAPGLRPRPLPEAS